jgi:hypothetical protein
MPPSAIRPKCDDVSDLREVAFLERDVVFEEIFIAPIKFASSSGPHEKCQADKMRNRPDFPHWREYGRLAVRVVARCFH